MNHLHLQDKLLKHIDETQLPEVLEARKAQLDFDPKC